MNSYHLHTHQLIYTATDTHHLHTHTVTPRHTPIQIPCAHIHAHTNSYTHTPPTHTHTHIPTHTYTPTHTLPTHKHHTHASLHTTCIPIHIPPTPDIHPDSHTTYTHTQAPVGGKLGTIGHHEWAWGRRTSETQPWGSAWKGFSTPRTRWHLQVREGGMCMGMQVVCKLACV